MKTDQARQFAAALLDAVIAAEAEGRDTLTEADLQIFATADDAAREELAKAIANAQTAGA